MNDIERYCLLIILFVTCLKLSHEEQKAILNDLNCEAKYIIYLHVYIIKGTSRPNHLITQLSSHFKCTFQSGSDRSRYRKDTIYLLFCVTALQTERMRYTEITINKAFPLDGES